MGNPLGLQPGQQYKVIKPFTDYDRQVHAVGEIWQFVTTRFLPYEDGLTLHVREPSEPTETVYRLQWRPEEQAFIIEHFLDYVIAC